MMTTKARHDLTDRKGSITSGSSCIDQLGNERRVAKHAPSDLNMSSFKISLVSNAGECNAKLTPPSEEIFTVHLYVVARIE